MCAGTVGDWCHRWLTSPPVPAKPALRGNKPCLDGCNGVGSCNYDLGVCQCPAGEIYVPAGWSLAPTCCHEFGDDYAAALHDAKRILLTMRAPAAGWTGDSCKTPFKRPCTARWRDRWDAPQQVTVVCTMLFAGLRPSLLVSQTGRCPVRSVPVDVDTTDTPPPNRFVQSHLDSQGEDRNLLEPGFTDSRCPGEHKLITSSDQLTPHLASTQDMFMSMGPGPGLVPGPGPVTPLHSWACTDEPWFAHRQSVMRCVGTAQHLLAVKGSKGHPRIDAACSPGPERAWTGTQHKALPGTAAAEESTSPMAGKRPVGAGTDIQRCCKHLGVASTAAWRPVAVKGKSRDCPVP